MPRGPVAFIHGLITYKPSSQRTKKRSVLVRVFNRSVAGVTLFARYGSGPRRAPPAGCVSRNGNRRLASGGSGGPFRRVGQGGRHPRSIGPFWSALGKTVEADSLPLSVVTRRLRTPVVRSGDTAWRAAAQARDARDSTASFRALLYEGWDGPGLRVMAGQPSFVRPYEYSVGTRYYLVILHGLTNHKLTNLSVRTNYLGRKSTPSFCPGRLSTSGLSTKKRPSRNIAKRTTEAVTSSDSVGIRGA